MSARTRIHPVLIIVLHIWTYGVVDYTILAFVDARQLNSPSLVALHTWYGWQCIAAPCIMQQLFASSSNRLAIFQLNFTGSDTLSAAYYAQYELNEGRPIAQAIPATEHSLMTSYPNELVFCYNVPSSLHTSITSYPNTPLLSAAHF